MNSLVNYFFLFICIPVIYSQVNPTNQLQNLTNVEIIKNEILITKDTLINNENGILLDAKSKFLINKNTTLTFSSKLNALQDKQYFFGDGNVDFSSGAVDYINVKWFGAIPDDGISDVNSIQKAINTAIISKGVSVVYFPPGVYKIDKPLLALKYNKLKDKYGYFNLTLRGPQIPYNNPKDKKGGVSVLKVNKEIPFALGIQGARGVHVENLVFDGYLSKKTKKEDLIYQTSDDLYKQERYAPLSAIVIDPFSKEKPNDAFYKGLDSYYNNGLSSTKILIDNVVVENFPTGISITPNGSTQQADSIIINETRFTNLINGLVICQSQSRNVVVDKCLFGRMKYAFNSSDFGEKRGVLPEVNNCKISDGVSWIYKANGDIAYGHFNNVYAEELYGIGYSVINKQPLNFINSVFKFAPKSKPYKIDYNPCILRADNALFMGCTIIVGGGGKNIEPLLMDVKNATFINCYLDSEPVNIGTNHLLKNKTETLSNNLRKIKLNSSNWNEESFNEVEKVKINYDSAKELYSFRSISKYSVKDFIFGFYKHDMEPFEGKSIFTAIGQVYKIEKNIIYFKSNLLKKKSITLKISKK